MSEAILEAAAPPSPELPIAKELTLFEAIAANSQPLRRITDEELERNI